MKAMIKLLQTVHRIVDTPEQPQETSSDNYFISYFAPISTGSFAQQTVLLHSEITKNIDLWIRPSKVWPISINGTRFLLLIWDATGMMLSTHATTSTSSSAKTVVEHEGEEVGLLHETKYLRVQGKIQRHGRC
jgi:hypothetical protein